METKTIDRIGDGWLSQQPIYRTDLECCTPADALATEPRLRRWRTLTYETDSLSGVMLLAGPETAAPTITYPLNLRGLYAVSIGVLPITSSEEGHQLAVLLKRSGDETFTVLSLPLQSSGGPHHQEIVEMFWRITDLTDHGLEVGQICARVAPADNAGSFECAPARVAYFKLVPLTDGEARAFQSDEQRSDTRRLFAHNDAHGPHYQYRLTTPEHVRREIEPYRDTDFSRIYWEAGGGDQTSYFSQIGRRHTLDLADFGRRGDRLHVESWREFGQQAIDPFDVALEYAHEIGLQFHASYRVAGFHYPPPLDHSNAGDTFYKRHPEWRGMDRAGRHTPRMAYSFPEVRQFVISLLREMAQRPIDGICLLYNRRMPLVEYEPPIVEGFKQKFGDDPRELGAHDSRWLSYRAHVLTEFMREVRDAMDQEGRAQGRNKRIEISAIVGGTEQENLVNGMDLAAWVDEGLVDTLIPYTSGANYDSSVTAWTDPKQLEFFVNLVRGTSCVLAPNLMPRHMTPEEFRHRAATVYSAGVEHMFFWDCAGGSGRANCRDMWNALRRLGHRDEIDAWRASSESDLSSARMDLRKLGDWDLSYVTPG